MQPSLDPLFFKNVSYVTAGSCTVRKQGFVHYWLGKGRHHWEIAQSCGSHWLSLLQKPDSSKTRPDCGAWWRHAPGRQANTIILNMQRNTGLTVTSQQINHWGREDKTNDWSSPADIQKRSSGESPVSQMIQVSGSLHHVKWRFTSWSWFCGGIGKNIIGVCMLLLISHHTTNQLNVSIDKHVIHGAKWRSIPANLL